MQGPVARRTLATLVIAGVLAACGSPPPTSTRSPAAGSFDARPETPAAASVAASADATPIPTPIPTLSASALSERIEPDTLRAHLEALQAISDEPDSGGTRATGTPGFERSVEYVDGVLASAGYEVARQPFTVGPATSWNVLAEREGTGDGVIVLGAHLDSVAAGPGLNDNASGVSALLAIAAALADLPAPSLTVRFAFWGAEEGGPFGSAAYVASLAAAEVASIRAYLNFDMLGSPNGVTFVYDEPGAAPGSDAVGHVVSGYFARRGLPWEPIDLTGHADHGSFTAAGIATGGLFSGGREPVTDAQAARHGAIAGQPADPCSHAACDTIDNVDLARLALMTDAIAAIVVAMAVEIS
ncbi:MAG TPA: M20/M25/M40 family metallo-hydrolase [Candidatus Limnocylindria bacterium]